MSKNERWLVGDFWSVFPGNQMPVQPRHNSDEEDGVGVWFISCQLMFIALLSVPVLTHSLLFGRMLIFTHELPNSEPHRHKSPQLSKGLIKVVPSTIVQVDAFIITGYYYYDGGELCVCWALQWINYRVRNLVVGCEISLHKSRKCGPTCWKKRMKNTLSVIQFSSPGCV